MRKVSLSSAIVAASMVLLLGADAALARNTILSAWRTLYPSSASDENADGAEDCQMCHSPRGRGFWNGYGWRIRDGLNRLNLGNQDAVIYAELFDDDRQGDSNISEINADSQPGWTSGANNVVCTSGDETDAAQPWDLTNCTFQAETAPAGILGSLDPSAGNTAPVANDDGYSTPEDTALNITAPGVLGNDTDADGDTLTAVLDVGPANGTLVLNADGSFSYTPNANFFGGDSFTYHANDSIDDSNIATVSLTVDPVNDAPVAADDSYETPEDTPLNIAAPGVLGNDTDLEGDALTAVLDIGPANGVLTLSPNGGFNYTPNANFVGGDSFTYHASDGTDDSNVATVSITVTPANDAPVAVADAYSTPEDTPLNIAAPGVLDNDIDADGDTLTAVLDVGPANGTLTLNANGSFDYTPNTDFFGGDSFTYHANDGLADSNIVTVSLTVDPVNDAPVAADDSYATPEDTPLSIAAPGVLDNDTDVEGNPLTAALVAGPANGSLTLNPAGSFDYTPNADFNGSDSFTYRASDGIDVSNIATVSIDVTPANDAPVAVDDSYSTEEDTALNVPAPGVLGNDTDVDGDALSAVLDAGPANGTLTLNPDGSFDYTPNAGFVGGDSFTYHANDGTDNSNIATVAIDVTPVNDSPVAVDDSYSTPEDTALNIPAPGVLGNDTDAENDPLSAVLDVGPSNGTLTLNADGSFAYTPNADFNGNDSFTYHANDGLADSNIATVSIDVTPVNDAPVAADDSYSTEEDTALNVPAPGVLGNDTDVEGDTLTAVLDVGPANGTLTLNPGGSFDYTPNLGFIGDDSFTYVANDGTDNSNVATVSITVTPVNEAPVAADDSYSTPEDTALNVPAPGVLGNDTDGDGDPLTAVLDAGPANGSVTLNPDGSFDYTPNADFFGADSFTYHANDGTVDSNVATVSIDVTPVNDTPVAVDDAYSTPEDTALNVPAPGVLGNDTDLEGDALTAVLDTGPANGTLVLNGDGSLTYTPNPGFVGNDSFTYHANDGTDDSNVANVSIEVTPVNAIPVANDDAYTTDQDMALNVPAPGVLGNDTDADGDTLTAVLDLGTSNGSLTLNPDGSFAYVPDAGFFGVDSFTYHANDGLEDSNVATATIDVLPAVQEPDINLNPDSLAFGNVSIDSSKTMTSEIENSGGADLTVDMIAACLGTSTEYTWSPDPSGTGIVVPPSGSVTLSVTYTPVDENLDEGCLEIFSDDPDGFENPALLALSGTGVAAPALDLDIAAFRVAKRFSITKGSDSIKLRLTVRNGGLVNSATRPATIVGNQAGNPANPVFSATFDVSDAVGDGRTTFELLYTPMGELLPNVNIDWTAEILDDDPDIDQASALTSVVP